MMRALRRLLTRTSGDDPAIVERSTPDVPPGPAVGTGRDEAGPTIGGETSELLEWVEIPIAEFDAISGDLQVVIRGDGRDEGGRLIGVVRYRCDRTGTIYETVYAGGVTRAWHLRPATPAS